MEIRRWTRDEWRAAAGDWSRLLQQSDADPLFLSFAWLSTWWQLYGGHGRELCMLAGYDTGRLIGIAPFYIERVGGPAFGHKSACVIGGARRIGGPRGMLTEYLDVIALREHADDFRVRALQFLDSQLQVKEYRINLSASWTSWQLAFERLSGGLHYLRRSSVALSYQADLGRGFNHYLSTLSSSSRRALWNRRALLASNGLVAVETAPAADALVTLQQLNELHRQRWGMPAFDEIGLRFHVQLVAALSGSAKVHLSKLSVGGQLVSVLYDLSVGATRYNIQMGFDEKFDPRLSLGKLHLGYAMEEAAKCGATRYDFLVGRGRATDYKVRIAQQSREICDLRATSRGTLGRLFIVADRVRGHAWPTERLYGAGFGRRATDSGSQTGLWREYLRSPGSAAPLRVGVMLDSLSLMRPFVATLRHIAQSDFAELSAVILNGGTAATSPQASKPLIARLFGVLADKKRRSGLLYAFYERRDRLSHPKQQALLDSEDVAPLLSGAVKLTMTPVRTGYVDRFSPADVESMRRLKLDVVLRYGFGIIRGEVLDIATCGIWSYHHDDNEFYRGAPPGFWELYENAELTGATLQVLNDSLDGGYVLARVRAPTAQGLSMVRNRVVPYASAQSLVIRKLRELHRDGWKNTLERADGDVAYRGQRKLYRLPKNREVLGLLARTALATVRRRLPPLLGGTRPKPATWHVGIRRNNGVAAWQGGWADWSWLRAPQGHYYADPMLWDQEGKTYLFVEDYDESLGKASIAVAELSADGVPSSFKTVLEQPHHLSFPVIFERDGNTYMLPESKAAGRIELFKAVRFPFEWRSERILLDLPGADSIVHRLADGTEVLLTSIADVPQAQASLHVFTAPNLHATWQLHPRSPIHCDARYSRNAGPLIADPELGLIRVSQDGSTFYGRAMHFHRLLTLNQDEYTEQTLGTRGPDSIPRAVGTHTYSRAGRWEATDALLTWFPASPP